MRRNLTAILSRLAFFVCGLISVLLGNAFRVLQRFDPDVQKRWHIFSAALITIGVCSAALALLPTSLIGRTRKSAPDDQNISLVPIKMLGVFAACSYLFAVCLYFAPQDWRLSPLLVFSLCPACVLTVTVDASLATVLLMLAPLSAAVYGSIGALVGFVFSVLYNRD